MPLDPKHMTWKLMVCHMAYSSIMICIYNGGVSLCLFGLKLLPYMNPLCGACMIRTYLPRNVDFNRLKQRELYNYRI